MSNTALTDDQVDVELKKLVQFIKQEALEKAREIQIKADEEFAIEKAKLVRVEISTIDSMYERRTKQASLAQQITKSNITNKTRLRVLAARQEVLDDVFEEASKQSFEISNDSNKYCVLLKDLILEGAFVLYESTITVSAREKDYDLIKKAIPIVEDEYKEAAGFAVNITINQAQPLSAESSGGVIVQGSGGRIAVTNTLEERLTLLSEESLPAIRVAIFGESPTRKFYD
ncbi:ATPase, V1/A1 complex, subunit E [Lipomyces doorenjongii]|uniref:ATPase, V1/A1 complex, subunit E n=1 Tax=Lipomyces doorenjongii TaxID=383834 RepID=UPI0034CEAFAE